MVCPSFRIYGTARRLLMTLADGDADPQSVRAQYRPDEKQRSERRHKLGSPGLVSREPSQ